MKTNAEIYRGLGSQLIDHQHSYPGGRTDSAPGMSVLPDTPTGKAAQKRDYGSRVVRMWSGGPLRHLGPVKTPTTPLRHARECFVGAYVCDRCHESSDGVYRLREEQSWLCGGCKRRVRDAEGR